MTLSGPTGSWSATPILGSHETVRILEQEGVPLAQLLPVGGGERLRLSPEVTVAVSPSLHSCVWTPKGGMVQPDEVCLSDLLTLTSYYEQKR